MGGDILLDVLAARAGIVCAVGAGGKKTTLYRLACLHPGRVAITSTVHIPPFPDLPDCAQVIATGESLEQRVKSATARRVAYAQPVDRRGRHAGVAPPRVAQLHLAAGFDVTFVKADGARSRWIKAPGADEPAIPAPATTVIAVVGARSLGRPLSDAIAHRVERIEAVTGARAGQSIEPRHVAALLGGEFGLLRGIPAHARVVPLLNMCDDDATTALAGEAARLALALTGRFDRVVLAAMTRSDPLVAVIGR